MRNVALGFLLGILTTVLGVWFFDRRTPSPDDLPTRCRKCGAV